MTDSSGVVVRVAEPTDAHALAVLRSLAAPDTGEDLTFERLFNDWLAEEGERRTTWLASLDETPVGMVSLFEYRRMPRPNRPQSRWGYVGNMFVRDGFRNQGIGSALLAALIAVADKRSYARLVLSPAPEAQRFFQRAGFTTADGAVGDRLLVRPGLGS